MKLHEKPQKEGICTKYDCGLTVYGSWHARKVKHMKFCKSSVGMYVLKLEEQIEELLSKHEDT